jgi:hypothetical protein
MASGLAGRLPRPARPLAILPRRGAFCGNLIIGNDIGTNNTPGDPIGLGPPVTNTPDLQTTGILVGASSHYHIYRNWHGIFLEGPVHASLYGNRFRHVAVPVKFVP